MGHYAIGEGITRIAYDPTMLAFYTCGHALAFDAAASDIASPPSLMPDERGVWDFAGAKGEFQELWCEYNKNPRAALRLGPHHLKRCVYSGSDEKHKPGQPLIACCD